VKRKLLIGLIVLALLAVPLFAVACGEEGPEVVRIRFAALPTMWGAYAIAAGVCDIATRYSNLEIVIESLPGADPPREGVQTGEYDMGGAGYLNDHISAYLAIGDYDGKAWTPATNIRLVIQTDIMQNTFMTKEGTGINSVSDLKGKRLPLYAVKTAVPQYKSILRAYGIDPDTDVTWVEISDQETAFEELHMGRIDAIWGAIDVMLLPLQEKIGQIVFLPIDSEVLEQAIATQPEVWRGVYPSTVMPGYVPGLNIPEPVPATTWSMTILANKDLADDAVYTFVKTLLEHFEEVRTLDPRTKEFSAETALVPALANTELPYHPGAVRAYKEFGVWTPEHESIQQALLK